MAGERPLFVNLEAWTDAGCMEFVVVTVDGQPADFTAWTDLELVAVDTAAATVASFVGVVTPAPGQLTISVTESVLKALLPVGNAATERVYQYVLRGRPTGSYRVRLMYGQFKLRKGLPEAT